MGIHIKYHSELKWILTLNETWVAHTEKDTNSLIKDLVEFKCKFEVAPLATKVVVKMNRAEISVKNKTKVIEVLQELVKLKAKFGNDVI